MKKLMVFALAFAGLACAGAETTVQKIVPVRNGDATQVFATVRDIMQGQVTVKLYQNSVVLNGSAEAVAAAEQLIKLQSNDAYLSVLSVLNKEHH